MPCINVDASRVVNVISGEPLTQLVFLTNAQDLGSNKPKYLRAMIPSRVIHPRIKPSEPYHKISILPLHTAVHFLPPCRLPFLLSATSTNSKLHSAFLHQILNPEAQKESTSDTKVQETWQRKCHNSTTRLGTMQVWKASPPHYGHHPP